ncbi:hypothetical protein ACFPL7_11350 [Dongia soli]|uniref:Metallo-beta-lactamase superfamily protein n=1 Tax=Dongia soli TaxID=600628 RepID=A0ABU5EC17_9PROT|nr:hypothetical protein [Dongia soli]MDY0883545.1 hypothetical protein [Dongia soli]
MPWGILDQLARGRVDLIDGKGKIEESIRHFPAPGHTPVAMQSSCTLKTRARSFSGDAVKYVKEIIICRCDMAFGTVEQGTASIERILWTVDCIVPGHFPGLTKQPNGSFLWDEPAHFDLLVR